MHLDGPLSSGPAHKEPVDPLPSPGQSGGISAGPVTSAYCCCAPGSRYRSLLLGVMVACIRTGDVLARPEGETRGRVRGLAFGC